MARWQGLSLLDMSNMIDEMARASLTGAILAVENEAKLNARRGFKSGHFVTNGWSSITHRVEGAPRYRALVGSTLWHFLYWEMGHHNLFTRHFERNRWLTKAFDATAKAQREYAVRAMQQVARRYGAVGQVTYRIAAEAWRVTRE